MSTPALNIPVRATGLEKFKQDMTDTSSHVGAATRAITAQVIKMNAGFLASQGAAGAATLAFGRVLGILGPIALGITAVTDTFKLMAYAVDLAKTKIADFNAIADKANASGFSTDFYQRISKSAASAKLSIDDATAALKNFNSASADKLGGSDLQQRIDESRKAGNFSGNSGIASLSSATNTEQKFRAVVSLIDQAMQKGERLAALDIAGKAFGPAVETALRADSGALDQMLRRADAMSKAEIISPEDIGRSIELKERMDEAQKILAEKWKPVQDDLAQLGMNYHASWVSITEDLAAAVGYATDLYKALHQVPDWFANRIGSASIWKSITDATTTPESRAASEAALGISSEPTDIASVGRNEKLAAALRNHANVTRAMQEATGVSSAVRGDSSKALKKEAAETADAFDRASESLGKHIARMEADAKAVGLGASAQEQLRAEAVLTQAAQQAGLPTTDALVAKIQALARAAGEASDKLAKARVDSSISFGRQTALLDPQDVAIARQLEPIFGNNVPAALASSQAAALRFNDALASVGQTASGTLTTGLTDILDGTKSVSAGFADMSRAIVRALEEAVIKMLVVAPLMRSLSGVLGFSGGGIVGDLPLPGAADFIGPVAKATGGLISGPGTGTSDSIPALVSNGEFVVRASATARHLPLLEAINAGAIPAFADGGLVGSGSDAPMIGGSQTTIAPNIQVSVQGNPGMSSADHQRMGENIGKAAMDTIRGMVAQELRTQTRPGGILRR
ncbi:hypothetical protein [Bradyrhizobium sp. Leo170]|uniref:hypothetical protein n=1 Tax=Bradyrhizobium sp. Leo170 TaxID=1571199 RepID=UPI00102E5B34|nr:hypothetical protein [Bradyrhizobium sp. Leo170]TAI63461.1 hypothetical protein CWO89_24135 [Bradyrhizobium sp. Leo170]